MKNFTKKLALVLALALVITSVVPFSVSAASKITLKSGAAAPASVYAGHSYTLKVAGKKVKFTSSNKKVATIGLTTGKMKAVAPGSVKITAKDAKSGKAVASKTFKVLQRAKSITADTELYLGKVGDTATIKAEKTPATSTDAVRFYSADKTIATVGATSGKVTAKKEGKTTIKVYSKATKATANSSKNNKVATVEVYVGAVLESVAQTTTTELKATFKSDIADKKFVPADFVVTNKETSVVEAVKDVKAEGKVVTLTMYNTIKDGKTYTVKCGEYTAEFTATEGKTAKLDIIPKTIPVNTLTEIKVVELDANGIIISQSKLSEKPANIDFTFDVTDGYVSGDSVYFYSLNSKAVAKATYHTYVYENNQETGKIETGDITITAENKAAVTSDGIAYTLSNKDTVDFAAADYKQNTSVPVDAQGYKVFFKFTNSAKKEIADEDYAKYTLSSSNNLVLMVSEKLDNKSADIKAVSEGTANIVVKNEAGTVVATLPVTVGKAPVPTTLTFDKTTVTLSNSTKLNDSQTVKVTVKDQYGNDFAGGAVSVEAVTKVSDKEKAVEVAQDGNVITFSGAGAKATTYTYTICYKYNGKDYLKTSYRVTVQNLDDKKSVSYNAILSESKVDTTVGKDYKDKTVDVKLGVYYGGVLDEKKIVDGTNVKVTAIKNSSNVDLDKSWYDATTGVITITKTEAGIIKKIPAGTYTITLEYHFKDKNDKDCVAKYYPVLTVTDKQDKVAIAQKKLVTEETTVSAIVKDAFGVTYAGKSLKDEKWAVNEEASKYVISPDKKAIVFKKIVLNVTISETQTIEVTLDVQRNVTLKNGTVAEAPTSAAPTTAEAPAETTPAASAPAASEPAASTPAV